MTDTASTIARLKIRRGTAAEPTRHQIFDVPFEEGQSLLDGLRWIRTHLDRSLAVRYACINANACKECVMRLDGKVVYACTSRLVADTMLVEPLATKPLIRDLVTETRPRSEQL